MSLATSGLAKELKGLLGAKSNAEVLEQVQALQSRPQREAVIVAVRWVPGEADAALIVLSDGDPPLVHLAEALRRGEAAVMEQMHQLAVLGQSEAARLRAQLANSGPPPDAPPPPSSSA